MALATMTSKGQVTIPKSVRDRLNLRSGDKIDFRIEDDGTVVIRPLSKRVDDVFGMLASSKNRKAVSVAEMNRRLRRSFVKRH